VDPSGAVRGRHRIVRGGDRQRGLLVRKVFDRPPVKVEDPASIVGAEDVDHPVTLVVATYWDVDNVTSLGKRSVVVGY
jgi:hypothetical protein